MGKKSGAGQRLLRDACAQVIAPGQVVHSVFVNERAFYGVIGSGLYDPVEIVFAHAGLFRVGAGLQKSMA